MKIGLCVGVPAPDDAPSGTDMIRTAAEIGYDYIEMPLASLSELDESEFARVKQKLAAARIACECLNVFLPSKARLTGEGIELSSLRGYVNKALARAHEIGACIVVFGSGGARKIPEGYPYEKAFGQLTDALKTISDTAEKYKIDIVIEPLNHNETNIILGMEEADRLTMAVARPNVKILLDYYHFMLESDSKEALKRLLRDKKIIHTHFAEPAGRVYPNENKPEYADIFSLLKSEGYDARCSIEARLIKPEAPRKEMETGLLVMRKMTA